MSWDLDSLVAIDTHVHVEQDSQGCCSLDDELLEASAKYFKADANRTEVRPLVLKQNAIDVLGLRDRGPSIDRIGVDPS